MNEQQNKTSYDGGKPEPLWQIALSIGFIIVCLVGPHVTLITLGPWIAIPCSILIAFIYNKVRFNNGRGSFGPMWLSLLDMMILFGSVGIAVVSCIIIVKRWLSIE